MLVTLLFWKNNNCFHGVFKRSRYSSSLSHRASSASLRVVMSRLLARYPKFYRSHLLPVCIYALSRQSVRFIFEFEIADYVILYQLQCNVCDWPRVPYLPRQSAKQRELYSLKNSLIVCLEIFFTGREIRRNLPISSSHVSQSWAKSDMIL